METNRLKFVHYDEKYVYDYLEMINDKRVNQYISRNHKDYDYDSEIEFIKTVKDKENCFTLIEKENGNFVGTIELKDCDEPNTKALGICFIYKQVNKKFGRESIKRILEYGFNDLKLDLIYLNVHNDNPRAIRCYELCGFKNVGVELTENDYRMEIRKEDFK